MYKALLTDLDGTAVPISSDGSDVSREVQQAVNDAQERGKKIACATGREWTITKPVVQALGFQAACIIEGGTRIIDPITEETLWEYSMKAGIPNAVLQTFKDTTRQGLVFTSDDTSPQELSSVTMVGGVRFIYLLAVPDVAAREIVNKINTEIDAVAHMTPSWHGDGLYDIHATDKNATKEHAALIWHQIEGVSIEETVAMGDSGNDIPLFQGAGLKVAVGNATAELKGLADYIAPNVEDGALQHVLDKFMR